MTTYNLSQGISKRITATPADTSALTIYTGGQARAYIETLHFTNITAGAATITVWINDGTSDFHLVHSYSLAARGGATSRLHLTDIPFAVNSGDTLKVQAGTGGAIDILGTIIQQTNTQG